MNFCRNEVYTGDGTVDLNGRPVLRSKTGNWNACRFILGTEWCERLAFSCIESNLMTYLTRQMHLGNASAAKIATTWSGTCYLTPLLGAFMADSCWGRYRTISVFSIIYIIGLSALTLSVFLPAKNVVFFVGLYVIALGTGGIKPCVPAFGADQFDDTDSRERTMKGSFFNWYFLCITGGSLVASSLFVWIQENVGWGIGYGIPALCMAVAAACFSCGTRIYRVQRPAGSPFTGIFHVIVAAFRNCKVDVATTQQVEEIKAVIRLLPILVTGIIDWGAQAQYSTTFVEQGMVMERRVGNFTIPAASLATCATVGSLVWVLIYEKAFVPLARKFTRNERGMSELQRIGIGYCLTILSMVCATLVETIRLQLAKKQLDPNDDGPVALSVLWQVPQYVVGVQSAEAI